MSDEIQFAMPGDQGNDCDIHGVHITNFVRLGNEFIITGSGGSGFWIGDEGWTEVDDVEGFEITAGIENELAAEVIHEQFTNWMERDVALHVVLHPGKYTSIIDHEEQVLLPLPRT